MGDVEAAIDWVARVERALFAVVTLCSEIRKCAAERWIASEVGCADIIVYTKIVRLRAKRTPSCGVAGVFCAGIIVIAGELQSFHADAVFTGRRSFAHWIGICALRPLILERIDAESCGRLTCGGETEAICGTRFADDFSGGIESTMEVGDRFRDYASIDSETAIFWRRAVIVDGTLALFIVNVYAPRPGYACIGSARVIVITFDGLCGT